MNKKNILYFHGQLGAGKTSTADRVAEKLNYERLSAGYFFRQEAEERDMSLVEFNEYIQKDQSIDLAIDAKQKQFLIENDNLVLDGRLGFYLMPGIIFSIFLDVNPVTAAKRILEDRKTNPTRKTELGSNLDEMVKNLEKRRTLEQEKLQKLYGIENVFDTGHFDLVVATDNMDLESVSDRVTQEYITWMNNEGNYQT